MADSRRDLNFPISDHPPPHSGEEYVGQVLGQRYRVESKIAEGAQGDVYSGTHVIIKRPVAIKILNFCVATGDGDDVTRRFMNEGRAAGTLGHPNIVESLDMGFTREGTPYLVMELLQGKTLADELLKTEQFDAHRAAYIARQAASALAAAHARGIVHRDMKPHNVFLVMRDGRADHVKVLDFGISLFDVNDPAKGQIVGTADYMAPEQISSPNDVDARTDVWALGAMLYQMLTGEPPFSREHVQETLDAIVREPHPALRGRRPDVPSGLATIVERALHKDRAQRYATMRDMEAALAAFATESSGNFQAANAEDGRPSAIRLSPAGKEQTASHESNAMASPSRALTPALTPALVPENKKPKIALFAGLGAAVVLSLVLGITLVRKDKPKAQPEPNPTTALTTAATATAVPVPPPSATTRPSEVAFEVPAPVPNAKMRFRGALHPLPFHADVRAGTEPELVEISAPQRQSKRYWITFDQAHKLTAELRFGVGAVDATSQELASALGDSAQPAPTADAPVMVFKPAGRATANATAEPSAAGAASTGSASSAALVAATAAASATAAATTATATATSAPVPTAPAAATATAAAPTSAPAATGPAPGTLEPKQIGGTVRQHAGEVRACYDRAKMYNPDLKGRVTVRAGIAASGAVTDASIAGSTASDTRLESCVASTFKTWQFPQPAGGVPGSITYTFVFE